MSCSEPQGAPSLEEQVAILTDRLHQAQRLTALGELASTTTHEFNNVLTTIINYARLGQRHRDAATRDKAFEKILAAGNRAAKITNGVLGLRPQPRPGISSRPIWPGWWTTRCCS